VVFDALGVEGHDLRGLPLRARKECLALFLPRRGVVAYGDHVTERGQAFFDAACRAGLEGIVAKRADSRYRGARTRDWLKIKCQRRQEFVIGGFTRPRGSRGTSAPSTWASTIGAGSSMSARSARASTRRRSRWSPGARAARTPDLALRRRHPRRQRAPLGRAAALRRGPLQRVDAGWRGSGIRRSSASALMA